MAQSAPHARCLVAVLCDSIGYLVTARRGYSAAAAPSAALRKVEEKAVALAKSKKMGGGAAEASSAPASSWAPDPVTGYYRPANRTVDIDAAELRQRLLSRKTLH